MPILAPVPLLLPSQLLHVRKEEKLAIMQNEIAQSVRVSEATVALPAADPAAAASAETEEESVILFHQDRHPNTYAELDNIFNVQRKIVAFPGNGTSLKGSLLSRTRVLAVFQTKAHRDLVMRDVTNW